MNWIAIRERTPAVRELLEEPVEATVLIDGAVAAAWQGWVWALSRSLPGLLAAAARPAFHKKQTSRQYSETLLVELKQAVASFDRPSIHMVGACTDDGTSLTQIQPTRKMDSPDFKHMHQADRISDLTGSTALVMVKEA